MGDLHTQSDRPLSIKRYEYSKLVALANIQAREIRIMELEAEIIRCNEDIAAQHKVLTEMDFNIGQQRQEIEKERTK